MLLNLEEKVVVFRFSPHNMRGPNFIQKKLNPVRQKAQIVWPPLALQNVQRVVEKLWFKFWAEGYATASNGQIHHIYDGAGQISFVPTTITGVGSARTSSLPSAGQHPMFYIGVYGAIGLAGVVLQLAGGWVQYTGALRASRILFRSVRHF